MSNPITLTIPAETPCLVLEVEAVRHPEDGPDEVSGRVTIVFDTSIETARSLGARIGEVAHIKAGGDSEDPRITTAHALLKRCLPIVREADWDGDPRLVDEIGAVIGKEPTP